MARQTLRSTQHMINLPSCLVVSLLFCGSVAAAPSWQQCQTITNDQQRLQCFDQWAATQGSRQAPVSIAPPVTISGQMASPSAMTQPTHSPEVPASTAVTNVASPHVTESAVTELNVASKAQPTHEAPSAASAANSAAAFGKVAPKAEVDAIELTVAEVTQDKQKLLVIRFAEGQTWRQVSASPFLIKVNDRCTIEKGLFGSYSLQVIGSNRSTKVKRVD